MRKSLPTQIVSKGILQKLMRAGMLVAALVILSTNFAIGQNFGSTECDCLGNGSNDQNGQFGETILVSSLAGENWTLVSSAGFFNPASPAPPLAPVAWAPGTALQASGGTYRLDGIRQPGTMWEVVLSNGTDNFPLSSIHTCQNPSTVIVGDFSVCMGGQEVYRPEALGTTNVTWAVTGGTIVSGGNSSVVTIDWDPAAIGTYNLSFEADAPSFPNQLNGLCAIEGSQDIDVMDEEAFALACNNSVNISLNGNCELMITADMLLEDMMFTNESYDLELYDEIGDSIVPGPMVGMEYINTTFKVTIKHDCSGNRCWGYVVLEDKTIPLLECPDDVTLDCDMLMTPENTGFPVPASATVTPIDNDEYLVQGFDLCSDVVLQYEDVVVSENLCFGPYSSIVERRWIATDNSGNQSTCSYFININRATLADITFPPNYDDVLGPNPSLMACGNFPKLDNGHPDPDFTGRPMGTFCLNVHVDYEDISLPKCGDQTFKIRRKWTVTDLCEDVKLERTQTITVMDNEDPTCSAPAPYTVGTGEHDCNSIIEVVPPTITDCSSTTYSISYKAVVPGEDPFFQPQNDGIVQHSDGSYIITQLPTHAGQVYILYYVEDACGNTSRCFTTITIRDDVQPTPVCDLHTFVAVGEDGIAYAGIDAFDDGSHDNCSLEKIEVRRMGNFACGSTVNWSDKVKFCCNDIGTVVMVQLRVTDKAGNSNVCMVEAEVQDNHAPEITFCPADITIDCDDDIDNLTQYGTATATDNCNVDIEETVTRNINDCNEGTITRRFVATDDFGNDAVCVQRITVRSLDPFYINPNNPNDSNDDIVWPGNVLITNGCADSDILPENLPSGRQEPVILDEGCSRISFSYEDIVFQYVDEACVKILRKWTVLDHCRWFPPFGTSGIWTYTQTIKVQNSTKPVFVEGCNASDVTITQLADCEARVEVEASATDDCTDDADLKYSYRIDLDSDNNVDIEGNGSSINRAVEFGTHRITWIVEDECGNIETCNLTLNIRDTKKPTPYCLSEIVTVIMAENGQVEIWASDFDNGSFDNCSSSDELRASFSQNTNDTRRLFTCDELTSQSQEFSLDVYITDPSGNFDFCTATLVVQDNQDVCGNGANDDDDDDDDENAGNRVALGGHIYNANNEMLESVELVIQATLPEFPRTTATDVDGTYAFSDLAAANDYVVKPNSEGDYRNGVNTLDLVKIQRHILGLEVLPTPHKMIAADINNDERLTPADLLQLRKLILGVYTELPRNDSWRFVEATQSFADPTDPWPFIENVSMADVRADYMDADFVAVKVGDVDDSVQGFKTDESEIETRTATNISTQEELLAIGYNEITFSVNEADIYGMQLVLAVNESLVSDVTVTSDALNITEENIRYEGGKLYISVNEAIATDIKDNLFKLKVTTRDEAYVSDIISLEQQSMRPMLVIDEDNVVADKTLGLEIKGRTSNVEHGFEVFQNVPNPFASTTDIGFVLPSDQAVTLTVVDITGKMVYTKKAQFAKGYNVFTLDVSDIPSSGIMHYQIDTDTHSETRKMIIIK